MPHPAQINSTVKQYYAHDDDATGPMADGGRERRIGDRRREALEDFSLG